LKNSQAEEMYNNLFEPKNLIFKEEKILSKSYVPKNIIGRNTELEQVAANLAPIPRHGDPINMYIWGDSGVGKTITIQYVLSILEYGLSTNNTNSMVDFIRIDSMSANNEIFACVEILSHLTATVPKMGLSISQYLQSIWSEIDLKAKNYDFYSLIIFFDEIDKFKDPNNILYQLSRSTENRKIKASNATIGIITASNKKDFLNSLDSKVLSSAGFTYLHFPDYSEEELCLILNSRREAFQSGAISEEEIRYCAQNVADRFHGDARRAIDTLHIAGKIALNQHCKRITKEHIDLADKEITNTATLEMIVKFSKHDKLLIIAIYICHQIIKSEKLRSLPTTGIISEVYRMICDILGESPTSEGHISRRLTDLDDKQLIHAKKVKGSGNTRYISLSSDIEYVIDSIYTTVLKAQIETNFSDVESYVISTIKLNRRNVKLLEFI
jgi:archaeal cell division control protein 6